MQWIAERFFTAGRAWIDTASNAIVRLRVFREDRSELQWNEECATLSTLRHPLLNAMVDYGVGPNGWRFEAYEAGEPVRIGSSGPFADNVLRHVTQFLRTCNVDLPPGRAAAAVRPIVSGRAVWQRPLGVRLQRRRALEHVEESLDAFCPGGPAVVHVTGSSNAGLRTLRILVARSARTRGFVPVAPATLRRHPALIEDLHGRHVCVIDDLEARDRSAPAVSSLISTLATSSARRHVIVRFGRRMAPGIRSIPLDTLSVGALVGMVFTGTGEDPMEEELLAAARAANGLPGVFVARLCGAYPMTSRSMTVHERAPEYAVDVAALQPPPAIGGRVLGAALRAEHRAKALAARGRHTVAVRVLKRAVRVLEGRERKPEAAQCAVQLGWLCLDRGNTRDAGQAFELARRLGGEAAVAVTATVGVGTTLVDERRLVEAEAVLRGALAAAETIHYTPAILSSVAALTRCLVWQDRSEEAIPLASAYRSVTDHPMQGARLLAALARAQARAGRIAAAVQTAREGQRAAACAEPHVLSSAELALGEALLAAGDIEGMRAATARAARLARASHLPLVRVRATLLAQAARTGGFSRSIQRLKPLHLPPLLAHRLQTITTTAPLRAVEPVSELEALLNISQRAADDAAAVQEICKAVAERIGASTVVIYAGDDRALAVHGRGWPAPPVAVRQVMAQGTGLSPDGAREPRECAEPIRYGGNVIAALACRWIAGTAIDAERSNVIVRAAALSAAAHVHALIDRPATPPPAAWGDLLGESEAALALRESVSRAARAPFAVLVEGESGSGKELVARAIHRLGPRRDRRFCALNCAALTDDLVESELFGHVRGAFTGAASERAGLFEEADGGTLFLDEVGELSARAQAKLLRVLQEGEVRRVGENFPRRVDVRVVAATNRRLEDEVTAGRFRADLRFRLDVVRIHVPPLRERTSDIPLLASRFWQDASARVGSRAALSPEALAALARYDWPGNVRELQNVIAWIAVQSPRRGRIGPSALPRHVAQATVTATGTFEAAREEFERRFVRAALAGANGQRTRAAATLGVTRQGLAKMIRRLGIDG